MEPTQEADGMREGPDVVRPTRKARQLAAADRAVAEGSGGPRRHLQRLRVLDGGTGSRRRSTTAGEVGGVVNDLSRLQADADACLEFLVERQEEWGPTMVLGCVGRGPIKTVPLTLVAVERRA